MTKNFSNDISGTSYCCYGTILFKLPMKTACLWNQYATQWNWMSQVWCLQGLVRYKHFLHFTSTIMLNFQILSQTKSYDTSAMRIETNWCSMTCSTSCFVMCLNKVYKMSICLYFMFFICLSDYSFSTSSQNECGGPSLSVPCPDIPCLEVPCLDVTLPGRSVTPENFYTTQIQSFFCLIICICGLNNQNAGYAWTVSKNSV